MADLKQLQGPVYSVGSAHNFREIERNLTDLKSNSRPINNGLEKMVCIFRFRMISAFQNCAKFGNWMYFLALLTK